MKYFTFVIRMILYIFIIDKIYYESGVFTSISIGLIGLSFEIQSIFNNLVIKNIKK